MKKNSDGIESTATRDRILEAAKKRFSEHSYEQATLRDIAADVGVDVALVHRAFGSKEKLFIAAVESVARTERILDSSQENLATTLLEDLYERNTCGEHPSITPLDITLHSLLSPTAGPVLKNFLEESVIRPLSAKLGHADTDRVAVVVALMAGLNIFRNIVGIDALSDSKRSALQPILANAINNLLEPA